MTLSTTFFDRLLYGSHKIRKSRLHDEKGNFTEWRNVFVHAPKAFTTGLLRIVMGYRPATPWIAYDAISQLKKFLTKDSRVLEFGSGISTVWYAKMAGQVYSVEDCRPWYDNVSNILKKRSLSNVHYHFSENSSAYAEFMVDDTEGFDLIMVDGSSRSDCIATAAKLLKPDGILYLDNSDMNSTSGTETPQSVACSGNIRIAEQRVIEFAKVHDTDITYFTDFVPTLFCDSRHDGAATQSTQKLKMHLLPEVEKPNYQSKAVQKNASAPLLINK